MSWKQVFPKSTGGGRKRLPPVARLYASGQLVLNHAAAEMIGEPPRVLVWINTGQLAIRIQPTTPDDTAGWSLSGGGNSQYRLWCKEMAAIDEAIGDYGVYKHAHGIELRRE